MIARQDVAFEARHYAVEMAEGNYLFRFCANSPFT